LLLAALVANALGGYLVSRGWFNAQAGQQVRLVRGVDVNTFLGLTAEELAFEPVKLMFEL